MELGFREGGELVESEGKERTREWEGERIERGGMKRERMDGKGYKELKKEGACSRLEYKQRRQGKE